MKHLIIYTHPNPESFNHAILETVVETLDKQGHEFRVADLYRDKFNPVLAAEDFIAFSKGETPRDIQEYQDLIQWADNLIFIYPTWWFDRPAMLQGWIDRVLSHGFAFLEDANGFEGLMTDKSASVYITFGGKEEDIATQIGLETITGAMTLGTLELVGMSPVSVYPFYEVPTTSDENRKTMLESVRQSLTLD
ncbi:NAD(P)H-dependent oxidoreductase [Pseudomaricurvus alkylphenolicus]|jgi:NAD(P)H dehydrogenase (quinone)|uniref:NAD(P)H-dependent oxidoreductase n=1 Tax=Pseudomaricurvus alkylphenolicus TaxID=1306991 RepID=UPI0014202FDD|nr:NAD(P)H-dependent oxidoreductase [Pseudomaricurvus alkylphenolicus]NIB41621.1 NAD(P)H-dependent oxidoreductase [Pseudomaricurvus alkylphenolicus]